MKQNTVGALLVVVLILLVYNYRRKKNRDCLAGVWASRSHGSDPSTYLFISPPSPRGDRSGYVAGLSRVIGAGAQTPLLDQPIGVELGAYKPLTSNEKKSWSVYNFPSASNIRKATIAFWSLPEYGWREAKGDIYVAMDGRHMILVNANRVNLFDKDEVASRSALSAWADGDAGAGSPLHGN